jgi:hypothetical protein
MVTHTSVKLASPRLRNFSLAKLQEIISKDTYNDFSLVYEAKHDNTGSGDQNQGNSTSWWIRPSRGGFPKVSRNHMSWPRLYLIILLWTKNVRTSYWNKTDQNKTRMTMGQTGASGGRYHTRSKARAQQAESGPGQRGEA